MFQPDEKMLELEIYLINLIKYEFFNFMHLTQCPGNSNLRFYFFLSSEMCKRNQSIKTNQQINQEYLYIYILPCMSEPM